MGLRRGERLRMVDDEDLLVALLNSAPVVDGVVSEALRGRQGAEFVARFGGAGSTDELGNLRRMRAALHDTIRANADVSHQLAELVSAAAMVPDVTPDGIHWTLRVPPDEELAVRAALAWSRVMSELPGRLRPCANTECNLFLVDHSRPGTARWCSMATCGNRMKARSHAKRQRSA